MNGHTQYYVPLFSWQPCKYEDEVLEALWVRPLVYGMAQLLQVDMHAVMNIEQWPKYISFIHAQLEVQRQFSVH